MSTTSALERIERWARQNDPAFVALLQPSLTRQEIDAAVGGLPFALAEEVYELYRWRNGQKKGEFALGLQQSPMYPFMSLETALDEYTRFQADNFRLEVEIEDCDFAESGGWFPLFGMERCYTATIGQPPGISTSPLASVDRETKTEFRYPSLTAMLEFRADLYETNVVRQDADGWVWIDYAAASAVQRRHFPERAIEAELNYEQFGKLGSPLNRDHYSFEAQRSAAVKRLVSSGSKSALPVALEYLQEQTGNSTLAASVLHDLLTEPNKVSQDWPWTRNMFIGGLAAHFQID